MNKAYIPGDSQVQSSSNEIYVSVHGRITFNCTCARMRFKFLFLDYVLSQQVYVFEDNYRKESIISLVYCSFGHYCVFEEMFHLCFNMFNISGSNYLCR